MKEPEIILFCPKCKKTPSKDEKQSNENWNVIPAKCPECELQLKIKVVTLPRRSIIKNEKYNNKHE